jgi:hypothetical protein
MYKYFISILCIILSSCTTIEYNDTTLDIIDAECALKNSISDKSDDIE